MVDGRDTAGLRKLLDAVELFGDGVTHERERVLALIDEALEEWESAGSAPLALMALRKAVASGEERP